MKNKVQISHVDARLIMYNTLLSYYNNLYKVDRITSDQLTEAIAALDFVVRTYDYDKLVDFTRKLAQNLFDLADFLERF